MPYVVDPFLRANVLVRFEFDMLFNGQGVSTASGLWAAQFNAHRARLDGGRAESGGGYDRGRSGRSCSSTTGRIITHLLVWALVRSCW
jgi:hypothetical protein